jgi:hypothetical protein
MVENGQCVEAALDSVTIADGDRFRARTAPQAP